MNEGMNERMNEQANEPFQHKDMTCSGGTGVAEMPNIERKSWLCQVPSGALEASILSSGGHDFELS